MQKITTFLWFDHDQAEEAADHYISVIGGDSRVLDVTRWTPSSPGEAGAVMTVRFQLAGTEYIAFNGGPEFPFSEAVSSPSTARRRRRRTSCGTGSPRTADRRASAAGSRTGSASPGRSSRPASAMP